MFKKDFTTKLTSERIYLRLLTPRDVTECYCNWLNDPTVTEYLATKKATISELQEYVNKRVVDPNCLFYGIFLNGNNLHIGNVKLEPVTWEKKHAIVGIMIGDKNWQGKGIAAETLKLITNYCFEHVGLTEVELGVLPNNRRAIIAYLKAGFVIKKLIKVKKADGTKFLNLFMSIKKS